MNDDDVERLEIRPVRHGDEGAVLAVAAGSDLFSDDELQELRGVLSDFLSGSAGRDVWAVAILDSDPVGVAYYAPERMAAGTWNLYFIGVHAQRRSEGVGRALVRHVEDDLASRGARVLLVETSSLEAFARTREFYRQAGYDREACIRDFYAAGDDKVVFWKSLAEVGRKGVSPGTL